MSVTKAEGRNWKAEELFFYMKFVILDLLLFQYPSDFSTLLCLYHLTTDVFFLWMSDERKKEGRKGVLQGEEGLLVHPSWWIS